MTAPARRTAPKRRQHDADGNLLTPDQLHERAEQARRRREARDAWAAGRVVPHRITLALDIHSLYGPEVDQACGAEEPAVDEWEEGVRYPTWEQLQALAELTGYPVEFFLMPKDGRIHAFGPDDVVFICDRSKRNWNPRVEIPEPVLTFTPGAIAATVTGRCAACLDPRPGTRQVHTCEQTAIPLEVG